MGDAPNAQPVQNQQENNLDTGFTEEYLANFPPEIRAEILRE
jgi:hypothetical protein